MDLILLPPSMSTTQFTWHYRREHHSPVYFRYFLLFSFNQVSTSSSLLMDVKEISISISNIIYIYIYIYIWLNMIDIFSTYFFDNPLELPYWSYDIRLELVDKSSIISFFPSTFRTTLGHYQGRMYYKSDATFVCTLLLCKKSVCTVVLCSVFFSNLSY